MPMEYTNVENSLGLCTDDSWKYSGAKFCIGRMAHSAGLSSFPLPNSNHFLEGDSSIALALGTNDAATFSYFFSFLDAKGWASCLEWPITALI